MKNINNYISEKLNVKNIDVYKYHPETKEELQSILKERLRLKKYKNADFNDIDVSKITDMSDLFRKLNPYNIDISNWDVSNVEDMHGMFYQCHKFNCDLSKWNVSNVKDMRWMFYCCDNFNSDLSNWDVNKFRNMEDMFEYSPLEKNPPKWYKQYK